MTSAAMSIANSPDRSRALETVRLRALAETRLYFAHQSVGQNLIDGVIRVLDASHIDWPVHECNADAIPEGPALLHRRIGRNGDPNAKLAEYAAWVQGSVGETCRFSVLKFCYADIDRDTDIDALFDRYEPTIAELERARPQHMILHMTVPLTTTRETWKTWLKQLAQRNDIWQFDDNIRRHAWNEKLRARWQKSGRLFDLAALESAGNGAPTYFRKYGQRYPALAPALAADNGHLNTAGQLLIATAWLNYLCTLI